VYDCAYDIIIGNNLVKSHRWSNYWKSDNFYIKLGPVPSKKPVQAHFKHSVKSAKGVSLAEITLQPQETAMVTLKIPNLDANFYKNWKSKDLFVEALFEEGIQRETNPLFEGLDVLPSYTKIDKDREVTVTIWNKDSKSPLKIPEGIEMVTVTTVEKRVDRFRLIFNQIPRVHNIECYCHRSPLEKTEISIYIEASDPYGQTSTRNYSNPHGPLETYAPRIRLFRHYETPSPIGEQIALTMLLIPDHTENYAIINEHDIAKAKETIQNELGSSGLEPLYFFLDPKFGFTIDTRTLVTEIYTAFPFTIIPVAYHPKHEQCIRPALRKNYPKPIGPSFI